MTGPVLRDIHQPMAPPWWPPAPGWWWLAAGLASILLAIWAWRRHRARKRARIAAAFDTAVDAQPTPAAQLAAMSDLLRRAARAHHVNADTLQGEAWLRVLDMPLRARGARPSPTSAGFLTGPGRVLLDGPFRRDVDAAEVDAVRRLARARFLEWMGVR